MKYNNLHIVVALTMLFSAIAPVLYADEICNAAIAEGKQKYSAGDYQRAKELFEYAQSECGSNYGNAQSWIDKCNDALTPTSLSVSSSSLSFGADGETKTITVDCNRDWSFANTSSNMFTVTQYGNQLTISCKANTSTSDRSGSFNISSNDGQRSLRVNISQTGRQTSSQNNNNRNTTQGTSSNVKNNHSSTTSNNRSNIPKEYHNSRPFGYEDFYVSSNYYQVSAAGGFYDISIHCEHYKSYYNFLGVLSYRYFKAWSNKNWLEEEDLEDGGRQFHVKKNNTTKDRVGELYIEDIYGRKITIKVLQKGVER